MADDKATSDWAESLKPFFDRHPSAKVGMQTFDGHDLRTIENPWGDPTLMMIVAPADDVSFLNNVFLPNRLSAVWHLDSKDLEVIWTAYELSESQKEIAGRTFTFAFNGVIYLCEFGDSSDRLLALANYTVPRTNPSETKFRNLTSFGMLNKGDGERQAASIDVPRSFWIRNVELSEAKVVPLVEQLNFYLSYYDRLSPTIVVHGVDPEDDHSRTRYPVASFPTAIACGQLDSNMLSFWSAARRENEMLQFILYYRVIEYAAFHYVDAVAEHKIKQILSNPARGHDNSKSFQDILNALDAGKMGGDERFLALVEKHVSPQTIWREVDANRAYFAKSVTFEGGFALDPLIGRKETFDTFATGGLTKFATALRKIRNVLAHGRDQRTATVITASSSNLKLLRPWVAAIAAAAGEVVLYEPTA